MSADFTLKKIPEMSDFDLNDDEWQSLALISQREFPLHIRPEILQSLHEKGMIEGDRSTPKGQEAVRAWNSSPHWDYSKDGKTWKSCAVVASDGHGNDILLHCYGPAIDWHVEQYGTNCEDLLLQAPGSGVWVWEGTLGATRYPTVDYGDDWDLQITGDWRKPTEEEWELIKTDECPWDKETLPRWPQTTK